jgi:hypothetical protein
MPSAHAPSFAPLQTEQSAALELPAQPQHRLRLQELELHSDKPDI